MGTHNERNEGNEQSPRLHSDDHERGTPAFFAAHVRDHADVLARMVDEGAPVPAFVRELVELSECSEQAGLLLASKTRAPRPSKRDRPGANEKGERRDRR